MSEETGARETEEFAALLRGLKDRSGLSYGVLATRLHMSTSTLHRYCNGTAVPNDYAPVERLARVCRATPQELIQLHRRWVLADAARGLRGEHATARRAGAVGSGDATAEPTAAGDAPEGAGSNESDAAAGAPQPADTGSTADAADEPVVVHVARGPLSPGRRRHALIASGAVAAVLVAAVLVARPSWDGGGKDAGDQQAIGSTASSGTADAKEPFASPSRTRQSHTPSASASTAGSGGGGAGASQGSAKKGATAAPAHGSGTSAVPLTVGTRPYAYIQPCDQHFLVDSAPAQVGPPASEQDAPRWAAAYGAVASGQQEVALTVQGTGADTVVLQALHVRIDAKEAPLAWNDYSMGTGCGGPVDTKSFDIDLDNGSPVVTVKGGQRDFPYKVSESDPEVFYVIAHTKAHDVRWDLTLDWSSGSRQGTVRIDNKGTAFRTSADVDRPGYDYPPGYSDWIPRES